MKVREIIKQPKPNVKFVNPANVDKYITNDLKKRGHTDEDISKMTPEEAFDEYCEW